MYDDYSLVLFMMNIYCVMYDGYLFVLCIMTIYSHHE